MSARVLVSGAGGFVGSAVVRALLRHGYTVRALARPASDTANLDGVDVEIARGDLLDPPSLERALAGCEGLFHVAADYRLWARDPREIDKANVRGTHNILLAAQRCGVRRIVHTSSVATLGLHVDGTPADEDTPVRLGDMIGAYKRSKFLSEALVRRCADAGHDIVIVNPSAPVGPRDRKPTPTGRMVLDAARGRMPAYVDTGLNIVHVHDVAEGHILAYEHGQRGRRYVLGGTDMSLREILQTVAELTGRHGPWLKLPHAAVLPVAYASEAWARITGVAPNITVDGAKLARHHMYFSSRRAETELGYRARSPREALADAIQWFRDNGYL
ncbi:MAG: Hopanoid-associated sugar epimerase HpnA [Rhodanobacteraceae bacterium]|jgi:dihydroflavonol-4-reductase|nr:MAG: Hopanoid-associated sugar epimerase HpnA [Rhodanobacteraceae bacterium]